MVLTAAGRRVLETARRVLGDIQIVEADIRRLAGHSDGSIRVCTQCNTGYHWLAPLLTVFQRKHPGVSVHVAADATAHPVEALVEGRVDLAILIDSVPDRRLRLRPLFTDEMVAIVARSHPLAGRRWLSAQDLAREHLLLYSSVPEESFLLRKVLAPEGLQPARVSFIMLTEAMIELARPAPASGSCRAGRRSARSPRAASSRCRSRAARCGAAGWRPPWPDRPIRRTSSTSWISWPIAPSRCAAGARSLHEKNSSNQGQCFAGVMDEPGVA
jgi:DNA-binding transcriptional LysR family regulator